MAEAPTSKLHGVELLNLNTVGWTFTPGLEPHQRVFYVHRTKLQGLLETRSTEPFGIDLEIQGADVPDGGWRVHRLYVLRAVPTEHPDVGAVLVSDVRWQWRYKHIIRRYNIRRRTGNRSLVTGDAVLEAAQFSTVDLVYAPFSLRPPAFTDRWITQDVVRDVFGELTDFTAVDENAIYANAVEIEGLELDDDGPGAAARVLDLIPGATVRVDEFGVTHIYNCTDGSETQFVDTLGAAYVGSTLIESVSMAAERPTEVHVHFTCEDEIRLDFAEPSGTREPDGRWMRNVIPLPLTLTYSSGPLYFKKVPMGTWVELDDFLLDSIAKTYPPITASGQTLPTPTLEILRHCWLNGGYNVYMDCFAAAGGDPVWANVMKAIRKHYRTTFQVNQRWADRVVHWLPRRVGLLDPVNNVWAQPGVWANYALLPSYRRTGKLEANPSQFCYNRTPFPTPSAAATVNLHDTARDLQAQATLEILDEQLGIFHVDYFTDPQGQTIGVVPSNIEGYDPAFGLGGPAVALASADVENQLKVASHSRLTTTHALSIILTGVTGSPNSLAQTYDVTVPLQTARSALPESLASLLPEAFGPAMHVHCRYQNARFAWSDTFADNITSYLLGNAPRGDVGQLLLVNDEIVNAIATTTAAKHYSSMADHLEGRPTAAIVPDLHPQGRSGPVEHGITTDGVAFTTVSLPPPRVGLDIWALLPEFLRRKIRGTLPG